MGWAIFTIDPQHWMKRVSWSLTACMQALSLCPWLDVTSSQWTITWMCELAYILTPLNHLYQGSASQQRKGELSDHQRETIYSFFFFNHVIFQNELVTLFVAPTKFLKGHPKGLCCLTSKSICFWQIQKFASLSQKNCYLEMGHKGGGCLHQGHHQSVFSVQQACHCVIGNKYQRLWTPETTLSARTCTPQGLILKSKA